MHIPILREVLMNLRMVFDFFEDVFGEEMLIVGYVEYPDIVTFDAIR